MLKKTYKRLLKYKEEVQYSYKPYKSYHINNSCIFIHIPKTGGTSILRALNEGKTTIRYHTPFLDFLKYNPFNFKKFFSFSFVRNPYDRIYSAYSYLVGGGDQNTDLALSEKINRYKDFDDFIINGLGEGFYRCHTLFLPQSNFIVAHNDEIMVDFVGEFENFDSDWKIVAEKLNLPIALGNINKSKREDDYRSAYKKSRSIEIVEMLYKHDIRRWDYSFE